MLLFRVPLLLRVRHSHRLIAAPSEMTPWLSTTVGAIRWTGCDVLLAECIAERLRQITAADACRDDNTIDSSSTSIIAAI